MQPSHHIIAYVYYGLVIFGITLLLAWFVLK